MIELIHLVQPALDIFARGGGGGSGGGGGGGVGGGGGSSGGSGSGSIWELFGLIGFLPPYYLGSVLRKKSHNTAGLILMLLLTGLYGVFFWIFGFFGFLISLAAFFGGPVGYFGWFDKATTAVRRKKNKEIIVAAEKDKVWNLESLNSYVQQVFYAYQEDWSTFNIERIKKYTTPKFGNYNHLMLAAIHLRGRKNSMENVKLLEHYPIDLTDAMDNNEDTITYYIRAEATDKLIETIDGKDQQLFVDKSEFYEKWHFARNGDTWLFDKIDQFTENLSMQNLKIQKFAQENGMEYSPDWGWLLLPSRGQLFGKGKFGKSDINNHAVGMYKNLLVELYTYIANPAYETSKKNDQIVIAQTALPKRYDSLIIEAKGNSINNWFRKTPGGYNSISLEWPDFNKRYRVFATDVEQVTAFELLHPVYMEKLFALPFRVNIEVVDNVLYLYSKDKKADYATMYDLLKDAFKEMKL